MNPAELHARASERFLALRALAPDARERELARLAADGAGGAALAREVRSLLAFDVADAAPEASRPASARPGTPELPRRLGPYRVLERIGRGGSGHVFLAEQDEPVRRRVAIKVVPSAALDPELAARFEVERRALEHTSHPNVARLVDAGRTPDGLPYLVMDYVEGVPITEHCAQTGLGLRERVALLFGVADGVQHAHQRGLIHRDLKPANVVVARLDGRATPIVLDFGIAKPMADAFEEAFPPTGGWPVGTPAYMAPEQARAGPIDTRADVYALGALLYELVAGRPPLPPAGDLAQTFQRLRDVVPEPPSRAALAAGRTWDAPRALLRDLDAIALKALEKAPEHRYPTVAAWRADLARALACEPIDARPPSWTYRTLCFARRERALCGGLALVFGGLVVGVVGLALGLREAARQRAEALDQREAQVAINRFLTDDLLAAASPGELGGDVPVRELVRRASEGVDERFGDRPLIAAAIHHTLGDVNAELGELAQADLHVARALALRRAAAGPDAPETLHSEIAAASLLARHQRFAQAEAALDAALPRAERALGEAPIVYAAWNDLGVALDGLGRHEEARAALERALEGRRRLLAPGDRAILATLSNLALTRGELGDSEGALALLEEVLALLRADAGASPLSLLSLENNVGATLLDLERQAEAEPHLAAAAELARTALGEDFPATLTIRANLASLQADLGKPEAAIDEYADVAERQARLLGADAPDALSTRHGLWTSVWKAGRLEDAAAGFGELAQDCARALGAEHWLTAQTRASLARALSDAGRPAEALPHARAAAASLAAAYGADSPRARTAAALAADLEARAGGARPGP